MALAAAIAKNTTSLSDLSAEYQKNVVMINTTIASVSSTELPVLLHPPADWNEFVTAYTRAKSDALVWSNQVMARLLSVPQSVQSYDELISLLLDDAINQSIALQKDPANKLALAMLNGDLNGVKGQLSLVTVFIKSALDALRNFQDVLPDMALQLQSIADRSVADAKVDQKQIEDLKKKIAQLNAEISAATAEIVAMGIADAAAITLATTATVLAFPVGAVAWLFAAPVIIIATYTIVIDSIKIKEAKDAVDGATKLMNEYTADVATLQLLAQNYQVMADQSRQLEDNLQAILDVWMSLEADVNFAIDDVQKAIADTAKADYVAVTADLTDARAQWAAADALAGALALDLQMNSAQIDIGMTQAQVDAAAAAGTSVPVIEYYNRV